MERVVLIGAITPSQSDFEISEYLAELQFLADTAGGSVVKVFKQRLVRINPKTFLGKGKVLLIHDFVQKNKNMQAKIIVNLSNNVIL